MSSARLFRPVARGGDPAPVLKGVAESLRRSLVPSAALPPALDAALGRLEADDRRTAPAGEVAPGR